MFMGKPVNGYKKSYADQCTEQKILSGHKPYLNANG